MNKNILFYATMGVLALVFTMGPVSADIWGSSDPSNANQNDQKREQAKSKVEEMKDKWNQAKAYYMEQSKANANQPADSSDQSSSNKSKGVCPSMSGQHYMQDETQNSQ